jgi:ParB-like chromosome segregation protein Spo0J
VKEIFEVAPDKELEAHPLAARFRMMDDDEFKKFKADVEANGQRETVKLERGTNLIVDGRNRFKACRKLGIPCKCEYAPEGVNLAEYITSLNAHRRHLSKAERDAVIVELRAAGESIPSIAEKTKRSVGAVHAVIKEAEKKTGKPITTTVKSKTKDGKPKTQKASVKQKQKKKYETVTVKIKLAGDVSTPFAGPTLATMIDDGGATVFVKSGKNYYPIKLSAAVECK